MSPGAIGAVFVVGLAVGLLSGLVGIGGGVLIVPFLYFFYAHPDLFGVGADPEVRTVVAHATSLFVIVPTALRGVLAYRRAGLVEWRAVWPIGLASTAVAVGAAQLATRLPPQALRLAFGLLLLYSALRLARGGKEETPDAGHRFRLSLPVTLGAGAAAGTFSALLGVGGGIVVVPILMHVGIELRRVAATSMGIVAITSVAGVLAYMLAGTEAAGRPPGSIGYVDVLVGGVMFLGSLLSVGWGAALNQRMQPRTLALVFSGLFAVVGGRLVLENLGVF
jgi:uncharacterized membrane protein YfcA